MEYQKIPADDTTEEAIPSIPAQRHKRLHLAIGSVFGAALVTFIFVLITAPQFWPKSVESRLLNCGNSPAEARRLGCKLDIISFAWQTPECFDAEIVEQFRTWDEWEYFEAEDRYGHVLNPITEQKAFMGEHTMFVREKFHKVHCTFMWLQMHRAYLKRGYIDDHLNNYNHTGHCQMITLRDIPMENISTAGPIIYPNCVKLW